MKQALILSGGGAKGAFTVGALSKLRERGVLRYDLISGTSTGSLISAIAAVGAIDLLRQVYSTVENDDILARQNLVENLLNKQGYIFGTDPLNAMIERYVTENVFRTIRDAGTTLCLTAIGLDTGRITVFSSGPLASPDGAFDVVRITDLALLQKALLASSSQAGFLPPVRIAAGGRDQLYVDGGNREVLPVSAVVAWMRQARAAGEPARIIVISNNPERADEVRMKREPSLLDMLMRAISIFVQDVRANDLALLRAYAAAEGVELVVVAPDNDLDPKYPTGLRFSQRLMVNWMRQGELQVERTMPLV